MALLVYDTQDRAKKPLRPVKPGRVGIYVCGLTVQGPPHVGHARAAVSGDVMARYLRERGFDVAILTNFTDVDDKIIARAAEEGVDYREVAERNIAKYHEMEEGLGIAPATAYPRATEHIPQIIDLVERLIAKGHAYPTPEGDVYFDVQSWPDYGRLSGRTLEEMRSGGRVEGEANKRDERDFALWKRAREGEPAWESPWGPGRPGWHIECSAMAMTHLGETIDIHGGGRDLVFPHHENERAQSEAVTGKRFVHHWAENGLLNLSGSKMSKSAGPVMTVEELLDEVPGPVVRLYLLQTHYRRPIDFDLDHVRRAKGAYERLRNFVRAVSSLGEGGGGDGTPHDDLAAALREGLGKAPDRFRAAMDDDFNTAEALGHLFDLVRRGNALLGAPGGRTAEERSLLAAAGREVVRQLDVLGVALDLDAGADDAGDRDALIRLLVEARARARAARAWEVADTIRDGLAELGIVLEDRPEGTTWKKA